MSKKRAIRTPVGNMDSDTVVMLPYRCSRWYQTVHVTPVEASGIKYGAIRHDMEHNTVHTKHTVLDYPDLFVDGMDRIGTVNDAPVAQRLIAHRIVTVQKSQFILDR